MAKKKTEAQLLLQLTEIALELGWSIAVPSGGGAEDDGLVHGLIIGEEAYLDYITSHLH